VTTVVNLRDFRGWGPLPPDVVRICRPTKWGNPYSISKNCSRECVVNLFRQYAEERLQREPEWLEPLRDKWLACWCAPLPCHGDVIVELLGANASVP
jgi:hypothetical protein